MIDNPLRWDSIEAVLFDLDGTLVETDNCWARRVGDKLAPLKRIWPKLDTLALGRRVIMASETPANYALSFLEHLGLSTSLFGLTDRLRRSRGIATRDSCELVAGSEQMLATLQVRYKMAVVTTRGRPEALAFLDQGGIARFFTVVITREDVLWMKPNPEPIRKAASRLGVPPERCLMVGDTVLDVRAARNAGACAVAVLSGFGERPELERAGANLILERAEQLLDYLPVVRGMAGPGEGVRK